jgi:hypothetical protein
MDIGSKHGYPASALSNFAPHAFTFDGVECASMEGLLQSFKFDKQHIQVEVCKLVGIGAKRRGSARNTAWKTRQTLWWKGIPIDRQGDEYQELLDRAFAALATNDSFARALLATQQAVLTHEIGRSSTHDTVLTKNEFCSRLTALRAILKEKP